MAANKKKKGVILWTHRFIVSLVLGANAVSLVALWVCCLSTWLHPVSHPYLSVLGLGFPIVLFCNVLFLPAWLLVKPRLILVPVVGMLLCGGFILDYYPIFSRPEKDERDDCLTVLTWNIYGGYKEEMRQSIIDYILQSKADIICLQEVEYPVFMDMLYEQLQNAGYSVKEIHKSRVLFSRYPTLSIDSLHAPTIISNGATAFSLLVDNDTICVVNCHLESNQLSPDDKEEYQQVLKDGQRKELQREAHYLWGKLAAAQQLRAGHVEVITALLDSLARENRPVLLCGDFNDTPISYSYQQIARRLQCTYRKCGHGMGITFNVHGFPVHIDHVFCSNHWEPVEVSVCDTIFASDHFPVTAKLRRAPSSATK